ncbi:MAG: hypothetical protein P4L61_03595, partial [Candidatus Pacebacteria bacterium]|nr:hypothetical protein [Candidatus Paceibacterota bacterium]
MPKKTKEAKPCLPAGRDKSASIESHRDPTENIRETLNAIRGKFGDDAIMKLGDKPHVDVDAISTGS